MELRVGNKYRLGRKIGSGSFGDIYLGKFLISSFGPCLGIFVTKHFSCFTALGVSSPQLLANDEIFYTGSKSVFEAKNYHVLI